MAVEIVKYKNKGRQKNKSIQQKENLQRPKRLREKSSEAIAQKPWVRFQQFLEVETSEEETG